MKKLLFLQLTFLSLYASAQSVSSIFNTAFTNFAEGPDLKYATIGLSVVNTNTREVIAEVNINTGLAPASTQKIITAATSYALLGHDYTYKTTLGYSGKIEKGILYGNLIISGSGDPTLGSWRYSKTKEDEVIKKFKEAVRNQGITKIKGHVLADESLWTGEVTPGGWIWQDIGNYYGAGARAINWRENQYDLLLASGDKIGSTVKIAGTFPSFIDGLHLKSKVTAAAKGSGDNAYIYYPLNKKFGHVRGTIPVHESKFVISGAMPHPGLQLAKTLESALTGVPPQLIAINDEENGLNEKQTTFYTFQSPTLDKISYWFLKKSINLYGESLIKTLGEKMGKAGSTESGVKAIREFWEKQGIDPNALNILDGSGLSPGNRITANSLVQVLLFSKKQNWFSSYYNGFPVIHGIKMKSGSINGVVSYTGFIKSKNGEEYTFAFIVNNYNGSGSALRKKMWNLLDKLK